VIEMGKILDRDKGGILGLGILSKGSREVMPAGIEGRVPPGVEHKFRIMHAKEIVVQEGVMIVESYIHGKADRIGVKPQNRDFG